MLSGTAPSDGASQELDGLTLRVLDIAAGAANATGEFNRDLVLSMNEMLGHESPNLHSIVVAMIERTARAEASLAEATRQAQALRSELDSARSDANHDRLTGLSNRAAIEERMKNVVTSRSECAVALVDVDRFKSINDTYGHGVGDRVLKVVAETLREQCAPHHVARWGGEEFLILFEGVAPIGAAAIVDQARLALGERRMKLRENDQPLGSVTFSAGVTALGRDDPATAIEEADRLLYDAKDQGRDRVRCSDGSAPL